MSPVASGSPPHTRATPVNGGGGPVRATNGMAPSSMDSLKGISRALPHLDDLVGARPDININTPFKTILQKGEEFSRQADTNLDFRRPEIALQDYVKATIIAVEILPKHKDFSALRDRPELNRLYMGLSKRINAQHQKFTDVKEFIKENNARHGARPSVESISAGTESNRHVNGESNHARTRSDQTGLPPGKRAPPPLQPKPDALHGKVIPHTPNGTQPADLAARFARLRSPDPKPQVQDPRIRTQPIPVDSTPQVSSRSQTSTPRPTGPREMPSVPTTNPQQPKIYVDVNLSGMPKPPDAIYSPDRGEESATMPNLKSSSSFSNVRKYSAPPISTVGPSPLLLDNRREYFSPAPTVSNPPTQNLPKRKEPSIPDFTMINAEDLMKYTGQGSQSLRVLLVDLRSREDFNSGHIMSQSIICVEPITLRPGISGEELSDTMVVAPDTEQDLYEKRQEFDLVVVYDQSSASLTSSSRGEGNSKLQDFMSAVYDYGYEKRLKRRPALLIGGLNAWIDLLGPNSLQTSDSSVSTQGAKSGQSLTRALALRNSSRNDRIKRRTFRQLTSQEQNYWESTLSSEGQPSHSEGDVIDDFSYAKTTEDFFRRYPELPSTQQSMVSPVQRLALQHQRLDDELQNTTPKPPTRPAPALPRQRSSGISDRRLMVSPAHAAVDNSITSNHRPSALTGLENTGVTCYINSTLQALSATIFLRDTLKDFSYPPSPPIPVKPGELGNVCPQLMVRCLGNLFGHLWQGTYDYVKPSTFLAYTASIDNPDKDASEIFGRPGSKQQDANEFFIFLMDRLEDELNPNRNKFIERMVPEDQAMKWGPDQMSIAAACSLARDYLFKNNNSPVSRLMDSITYQLQVCKRCNLQKRKWNSSNYINLPVEAIRNTPQVTDLAGLLRRHYGTEDEEFKPGFICDKCKQQNTTYGTDYICHYPDYLVINLSRFKGNLDGSKADKQIRFTESVDLTSLSPFGDVPINGLEGRIRQQTAPFKYQVYAVVRHHGSSIRGGHYTTVARHLDLPRTYLNKTTAGAWHEYNDKQVRQLSPSEIGNISRDAAIIFLKREGSPNRPPFV